MNFIVVGGGCYGSFYTRQLLRGADRISLEKIHIIDRDLQCQVAREYPSEQADRSRLIFHVEDWKSYLHSYLGGCLDRHARGEEITDHYVPPCFAPHILFELFIEKAREEFSDVRFSSQSIETTVGTPFETSLPSGQTALSFATWTCPYSCIEPSTCPKTRGPKNWDIRDHLTAYFDGKGAIPEEARFFFQCLHFTMGVGTIPMKDVVAGYLKFRKIVSRREGARLALATMSSCHGLVGLMETHDG